MGRNKSQKARHAPAKKAGNNGTGDNGEAAMRTIARLLLIIETSIIILGAAVLLEPGADLLAMRFDNVDNRPKDQSRIVPSIGSLSKTKNASVESSQKCLDDQ
jgi:hypothetical protein